MNKLLYKIELYLVKVTPMTYWFADDDCKAENKVVKYFKEY